MCALCSGAETEGGDWRHRVSDFRRQRPAEARVSTVHSSWWWWWLVDTVIWHGAAPLSPADRSVVFTRWCWCVLYSIHSSSDPRESAPKWPTWVCLQMTRASLPPNDPCESAPKWHSISSAIFAGLTGLPVTRTGLGMCNICSNGLHLCFAMRRDVITVCLCCCRQLAIVRVHSVHSMKAQWLSNKHNLLGLRVCL